MIPFILAAIGGYIIGDSMKSQTPKFEDGGMADDGAYLYMYECDVSLNEKTIYGKSRVSQVWQVWAKSTADARKLCEKQIKEEHKDDKVKIKSIKQTEIKTLKNGADLENITWQKRYYPFTKEYGYNLLIDGKSVYTSIAKSWNAGDKWVVQYSVLGRKIEDTFDSENEAKEYVLKVLKEQLKDKKIKDKLVKEIIEYKKDSMVRTYEDGGMADKYVVERDKDGTYRILNTETNMYVEHTFQTKAGADNWKEEKDIQRNTFGRESYFANGGMPKEYQVVFWETEEDRDTGESSILGTFSLDEAMEQAKKLYYKVGVASVEVIEKNSGALALFLADEEKDNDDDD